MARIEATKRAGRDDGLTAEEGAVMDALVNAVNAFGALPRSHPSDLDEFCDGIHRCQAILALRIARRHYPEGWVMVEDDRGQTRTV
jgi:hypothetical protein